MSHQNSSSLDLTSEVFFPVTIHLHAWLPSFFAPSHETVVVAVSFIWLSLAAGQTQPLSLLWLLSHCGRPLMASFQCVNSCQVLESPTTALRAGLTNTQQGEKFPQLPGYSLSTTGGFQKCSDHGPKLSLVPPNCQCTHWSKTITSSCFVYCRASRRARSLASDLPWKSSVIVSLWISWVLKSNLPCTALCVCREQTELDACYGQIP